MTSGNVYMTWDACEGALMHLYKKVVAYAESRNITFKKVVAVSSGGDWAGQLMGRLLEIPVDYVRCRRVEEDPLRGTYKASIHPEDVQLLAFWDRPETLVIDDIYDTGSTFRILFGDMPNATYGFLYSRDSRVLYGNAAPEGWVVFPWEQLKDEIGTQKGERVSSAAEPVGEKSPPQSVTLNIHSVKHTTKDMFKPVTDESVVFKATHLPEPPRSAKVTPENVHRASRAINTFYMNGIGIKGKPEELYFLTLALVGEAGELANLIKKRWRDGSLNLNSVKKEIADIEAYLLHIKDFLSITDNLYFVDKTQEVLDRIPQTIFPEK